MEMEVCISFSERIGFSVNVEAVRWRRIYSIGVSESIFPTCNYGRCQDGDGCTVLVFQKTFFSCKYGRCQDEDGYTVLAFPKTLSPCNDV